MSGPSASRVLLVALALATLAALVPMLRGERELQRGIDQARRGDVGGAQARFARAREDLGGEEVRLREAQALAFARRPQDVVGVLLPAARREPDNEAVWRALLAAARTVDPAVAARARERLRRLDPQGER